MEDLPKRSQGALFHGVLPDPENPGHNQTFLQMRKRKDPIVPDGDLDDVDRCQVVNEEVSVK